MSKAISILCALLAYAQGTSVKMDFLPSGHVRTDPIVTQTCLSDHMHTFYGANVVPYPDLTYDELRAVGDGENTGNVEENKSIYWHPSIYKYDPTKDTYYLDEIGQSSAYYIWETGLTKAFPNNFRMIAGTKGNTEKDYPNANAECVNPSSCKRSDSCETENSFFPESACEELEVSMFFPGCWDGVNLDSEDHMSHVAYTLDGEPDGDCPDSHRFRIPVIALFFRIFNYDGGWHTFSDETGIYHADYISGWDEEFLQSVLDECENDSFGPNPDAFCDDHLTFRDAPKCSNEDCDFSDPNLLKKLQKIQPSLHNFEKKISPEKTKEIKGKLPRKECTGTLLPRNDSPCENNPNFKYKGKAGKTCNWIDKKKKRRNSLCEKNSVQDACPETCGLCSNSDCTDNENFTFKDKGKTRNCKWVSKKKSRNKKFCRNSKVKAECEKICGQCTG